ncbi:DUF2514 family protein [Pseudomonas kermanshahensis]|uniref:DUF2514 family protein n=1 Tax=Pseudomonas kermanshahensis TaxID=2745482 RepID=A0ABU8R1N9_9PSED
MRARFFPSFLDRARDDFGPITANLLELVAADQQVVSALPQLDVARRLAAAVAESAGGLRGEIARVRAGQSATCDTIATQQRKTGTSAVVVLGGLLEESDRMAGHLATALERSRIAALVCERILEVIKDR